MKGSQIILGTFRGRETAVLMIDGALADILVAPPEVRALPGAIYRAIPDRPMKGMGGQFVRLPGGTGFLRQTKGIAPGRPFLVQVAGFAEVGKAVPVTNRLSLRGRTAVVTPNVPGRNVSRRIADADARAPLEALAQAADLPENCGLIIRSEAEGEGEGVVADEIVALADMARTLLADIDGAPELLLDGPGPHETAWRDWGTADAVDRSEGALDHPDIEDAIDALLRPEVPLPTGGRMTIEPTRALVAIDIDTGGDTSPAAALKANIAAARALPRELACRGLGGQITIDFAPIPRRDRQRIEQVLGAALRHDPVGTDIAGWTPLSHLELRRRRIRLPLSECLK